MRVKINIQIFAIIIILVIANQIKVYAWLMLFALIHELAHMLTGMLLKLKPRTLEIQPFGICVVFESFEKSEKNKIIIALAGPLINIVMAIIFSFINIEAKEMIINCNVILALFNLLPIYPLDGGRILKSIIKVKSTDEKAEDITNKISNILMIIITIISSILILIYKNIGIVLIIAYLWIIIIKENNKYMLKKRIYTIINKKNT